MTSTVLKIDFTDTDDPRSAERRAVTKQISEHAISVKEGAEKLAKLGCSIDRAWHLATTALMPS